MTSTAIRSYRDLRVWQIAMELVETTYRLSQAFPTAERFGLTSQMRRAAVSIASNIAEGHARSLGDYLRHLVIAAGSLRELETQVELAIRLALISNEQGQPILLRGDELGRMLWSLRKRLAARRSRPGALRPVPGS